MGTRDTRHFIPRQRTSGVLSGPAKVRSPLLVCPGKKPLPSDCADLEIKLLPLPHRLPRGQNPRFCAVAGRSECSTGFPNARHPRTRPKIGPNLLDQGKGLFPVPSAEHILAVRGSRPASPDNLTYRTHCSGRNMANPRQTETDSAVVPGPLYGCCFTLISARSFSW